MAVGKDCENILWRILSRNIITNKQQTNKQTNKDTARGYFYMFIIIV